MAFFELHCGSSRLGKQTAVNVILPELNEEERAAAASGKLRFPTLYLLHGYSDDHTIWERRTRIERLADDYRLAVVMPDGGKSWYVDDGGDKYGEFITDELPAIARAYFPLSAERRDNYIAGLSMGGYGAFRAALARPEAYGAAMSLSGALGMVPGFRRDADADAVKTSENNLSYLLERGVKGGVELPRMIFCCGTEDFLLESNRSFDALARSLGCGFTYYEEPGTHEWGFWDRNIAEGLKFFAPRGLIRD